MPGGGAMPGGSAIPGGGNEPGGTPTPGGAMAKGCTPDDALTTGGPTASGDTNPSGSVPSGKVGSGGGFVPSPTGRACDGPPLERDARNSSRVDGCVFPFWSSSCSAVSMDAASRSSCAPISSVTTRDKLTPLEGSSRT